MISAGHAKEPQKSNEHIKNTYRNLKHPLTKDAWTFELFVDVFCDLAGFGGHVWRIWQQVFETCLGGSRQVCGDVRVKLLVGSRWYVGAMFGLGSCLSHAWKETQYYEQKPDKTNM